MDIGRRIRFTDGREVDKKRIFLGLAGVGAAVAAIALGLDYSQGERAGSIATSSSQAKTPVSPERLAQLPAREAIGKPRGQPFDARSWAPPAPPASKVAPAPPKPVAPPVQYRVAGQVSHDGVMEVVLAHGDRIFTVREGETLEDIYRIEAITPDAVTLVYLPLNERQQIPVAGLRLETAAPAAVAGSNAPARAPSAEPQTASRPAQLRWEGPKQVQAGENFDVTLKLTSAQPVRALPLQLSYDAKLLEPVAVRPGGLFADGRFSYRVNPGGSIFVGASANEATPADADLMVVTFRPIRSGDAELRLSSLALQGAAGRPIAHEPPAAFRTAIVQ